MGALEGGGVSAGAGVFALLRGEGGFQRGEQVVAAGVADGCGGGDPRVGGFGIAGDTESVGVHVAELDAGSGGALGGGLAEEGEGLSVVARQAFAPQVEVGEIVLAERVAGVGGLTIEAGGGGGVAGQAESLVVEIAEVGLGLRVAGVRALLEPAASFGVVLPDAESLHVEDAEVEVGGGEVLRSGFAEPAQGGGVVDRGGPSVGVQDSKVDLGGGVSLLRGPLEPPEGFGGVEVGADHQGHEGGEAELILLEGLALLGEVADGGVVADGMLAAELAGDDGQAAGGFRMLPGVSERGKQERQQGDRGGEPRARHEFSSGRANVGADWGGVWDGAEWDAMHGGSFVRQRKVIPEVTESKMDGAATKCAAGRGWAGSSGGDDWVRWLLTGGGRARPIKTETREGRITFKQTR